MKFSFHQRRPGSLSNNDLNYLIVCLFLGFIQHLLIVSHFLRRQCLSLRIISIMKLLCLYTSRHFLYFPPEKRIVYDIYHFMLVSSNSQSLLNQRKGNKENISRTFIDKVDWVWERRKNISVTLRKLHFPSSMTNDIDLVRVLFLTGIEYFSLFKYYILDLFFIFSSGSPLNWTFIH